MTGNETSYAERIGELTAEIRHIRADLELMRNMININAETRIYKAGESSGFSRALRYMDIAARILGTVFICSVLVAAGQFLGAFEYFFKLFKL